MDVLDLIHLDTALSEHRPHACHWDNCSKAFARRCDLVRHLRIHTNERPFACTIPGCNKSFIQRSALTVHLRTHSGERPHICEEPSCRRAFSHSSSLARHRRVHAGKFLYRCTFNGCGKSFRHKQTLTKHRRTAHVLSVMERSSTAGPMALDVSPPEMSCSYSLTSSIATIATTPCVSPLSETSFITSSTHTFTSLTPEIRSDDELNLRASSDEDDSSDYALDAAFMQALCNLRQVRIRSTSPTSSSATNGMPAFNELRTPPQTPLPRSESKDTMLSGMLMPTLSPPSPVLLPKWQ